MDNTKKIRIEAQQVRKVKQRNEEISKAITDAFMQAESQFENFPIFPYRLEIIRDVFIKGYELGKQHQKEDKS